MIYTGLNGSGEVEAVYAAKRVTTTGTPPLSYPSKGYDLEDFLISGNTVQNGTPTPSDPVDVVGCGVWDETQQSYKLPLTVNGTEHPIYLGQVETTRQIKKLVLTGEEDWTEGASNIRYITTLAGALSQGICSHFTYGNSAENGNFDIVTARSQIRVNNSGYSTLSDFIAFLRLQHANGAPVTVWYVLEEPETAVVNEPLHKISTYADTISLSQSGITVPTTKGVNTITTETTVLPSSISVTTPEKEVAEVYSGINYQNPVYYKTRTLTGQAPLSYKALSKPLSDYLISGNTVQNGTPTPEAPVDVVGCGVRTGNLCYEKIRNSNVGTDGRVVRISEFNCFKAKIIPGETYTVSLGDQVIAFFEDEPSMGSYSYDGTRVVYSGETYTFIAPSGCTYVLIRAALDTDPMLNLGSTPLPYEPYGYKLPISCGGITTNVYLGEQSATRQIKKLVLTGEENWVYSTSGAKKRVYTSEFERALTFMAKCSHFVISETFISYPDSGVLVVNYGSAIQALIFGVTGMPIANESDFKAYLAAEYANGTPVTVWYVLAEPETAITNEPLHKIGDYADTVSFAQAGVTIPTAAGANTLTVDTTVQPSAVSITGNIKLI